MAVEFAQLTPNKWHSSLGLVKFGVLIDKAVTFVLVDPVLDARVGCDLGDCLCAQVKRLANEATECIHAVIVERIYFEVIEQLLWSRLIGQFFGI